MTFSWKSLVALLVLLAMLVVLVARASVPDAVVPLSIAVLAVLWLVP